MLQRIRIFLRSIANNLLGRTEKDHAFPRMEQALQKMQGKLIRYKEAVAVAVAHEKTLKRQLDETQLKMEKLHSQAKEAVVLALSADDREKERYEHFARMALRKRSGIESGIAAMRDTWLKAHETAEKARKNFEVIAEQVSRRAKQLNEMKVLHQLNLSRQEIIAMSSSAGLESAAQVFNDGITRVQEEADRIEALEQLALLDGEQWDRTLEEITTDSLIDQEYDRIVHEITAAGQKTLPEKTEESET